MDSKQLFTPNFQQFLKNATIYELNVRQYSEDSKFKSIIPHLQRIKKLGIDIIWFMPIHPIGEKERKGSLGSYYSVRDYLDINPEFGSKEDFKTIIKEIHKLGMIAIIDWVPNHTSTDHVWTTTHRDYYCLDPQTKAIMNPQPSWSDVYQLNYNNPEFRQAMINAMIYWIKDFDIDGFRCDVAYMVPQDFWNEANRQMRQVKQDIFMLCEDDQMLNQEQKNNFQMDYAFTLMKWMKLNRNGKDKIFRIKAGKPFNEGLDGLRAFIEEYQNDHMADIVKMFYVTNHDENSANGGEYQIFGEEAVKLYTVLAYTLSGMPLVYSGQEIPVKRSIQFFDKDTLPWTDKLENEQFIQQLLTLHHQNEAMWNGVFGGKVVDLKNSEMNKVFSFSRQKNQYEVIVILNFTNQILNTQIKLMVNDDPQQSQKYCYENIFDRKQQIIFQKQNTNDNEALTNVQLSAFDYLVLEKCK